MHLRYNQLEDLEGITENTAGVIAETVQGEAGIIAADPEWLRRLRLRCTETGALLVLDEVQAGLGRTGMLWAFEQYGITPDVLIAGKALGGGMPLGAFMAAPSIMEVLASKPVLGHITTFGGHPVCCAAGMAAFERLLDGELIPQVKNKERLFLQGLRHERIRKVRSSGLMIAVEFDSFETNKKVIDRCIAGGVLTDWFLFAPECMRIAPPLIISGEQIQMACQVITEAVASV
jgi:acetylornithine/succinyldiaminopimelate/putrescine aminotransferase